MPSPCNWAAWPRAAVTSISTGTAFPRHGLPRGSLLEPGPPECVHRALGSAPRRAGVRVCRGRGGEAGWGRGAATARQRVRMSGVRRRVTGQSPATRQDAGGGPRGPREEGAAPSRPRPRAKSNTRPRAVAPARRRRPGDSFAQRNTQEQEAEGLSGLSAVGGGPSTPLYPPLPPAAGPTCKVTKEGRGRTAWRSGPRSSGSARSRVPSVRPSVRTVAGFPPARARAAPPSRQCAAPRGALSACASSPSCLHNHRHVAPAGAAPRQGLYGGAGSSAVHCGVPLRGSGVGGRRGGGAGGWGRSIPVLGLPAPSLRCSPSLGNQTRKRPPDWRGGRKAASISRWPGPLCTENPEDATNQPVESTPSANLPEGNAIYKTGRTSPRR